MRIITLDLITVKDTSTYKGLNTQTFPGLRHRSQGAKLRPGHSTLKHLGFCFHALYLTDAAFAGIGNDSTHSFIGAKKDGSGALRFGFAVWRKSLRGHDTM